MLLVDFLASSSISVILFCNSNSFFCLALVIMLANAIWLRTNKLNIGYQPQITAITRVSNENNRVMKSKSYKHSKNAPIVTGKAKSLDKIEMTSDLLGLGS